MARVCLWRSTDDGTLGRRRCGTRAFVRCMRSAGRVVDRRYERQWVHLRHRVLRRARRRGRDARFDDGLLLALYGRRFPLRASRCSRRRVPRYVLAAHGHVRDRRRLLPGGALPTAAASLRTLCELRCAGDALRQLRGAMLQWPVRTERGERAADLHAILLAGHQALHEGIRLLFPGLQHGHMRGSHLRSSRLWVHDRQRLLFGRLHGKPVRPAFGRLPRVRRALRRRRHLLLLRDVQHRHEALRRSSIRELPAAQFAVLARHVPVDLVLPERQRLQRTGADVPP